MRQERIVQATIFEILAGHQIGYELKAVSAWLDKRSLVRLVTTDVRCQGLRQTGQRGLPAKTVLSCALLKQQRSSVTRNWPFTWRSRHSFAPSHLE
jgi:IS5 family transposase